MPPVWKRCAYELPSTYHATVITTLTTWCVQPTCRLPTELLFGCWCHLRVNGSLMKVSKYNIIVRDTLYEVCSSMCFVEWIGSLEECMCLHLMYCGFVVKSHYCLLIQYYQFATDIKVCVCVCVKREREAFLAQYGTAITVLKCQR